YIVKNPLSASSIYILYIMSNKSLNNDDQKGIINKKPNIPKDHFDLIPEEFKIIFIGFVEDNKEESFKKKYNDLSSVKEQGGDAEYAFYYIKKVLIPSKQNNNINT